MISSYYLHENGTCLGDHFNKMAAKQIYTPKVASYLLAAAAAAASSTILFIDINSKCRAPPQATTHISPPTQSEAVNIAALKHWLHSHQGATVDAISFGKPSSTTHSGRLAIIANSATQAATSPSIIGRFTRLFYSPWKEATLAIFPTNTALISSNILTNPEYHQILNKALQDDIIPNSEIERIAVVLHLIIEKNRGNASPFAPWVRMLPTQFDTPLFWSDHEMQWLRGTALYRATEVRRETLKAQWRVLEPLCFRLALSIEGGSGDGSSSSSSSSISTTQTPKKPTYDDFMWAQAIFWSRAKAVPFLSTSSSNKTNTNQLIVQEGIIPGLDFANHSPSSKCRWTIATSSTSLVCSSNARLKPGNEITINYGDKSNEELLFLYGFVQENNNNDVLMVPCPLKHPSEWDPVMQARIALLQSRGLAPRLFLPLSFLDKMKKVAVNKGASTNTSKTKVVKKVEQDDIPSEVMQTLEVFVMETKDLTRELESIDNSGHDNNNSGAIAGRKSVIPNDIQRSGLRMALLTTLVRLLELKVLELEGMESGTGSLENDERLMMRSVTGEEGGGEEGALLSGRERMALVYRIGQKKLAREYLDYGKELLEREMGYLASLH